MGDLEHQMEQPVFWTDPDTARRTSREVAALRSRIEEVTHLEREVADLLELIDLVTGDDAGALADVERETRTLGGAIDRLELATLLGGEHDPPHRIPSLPPG